MAGPGVLTAQFVGPTVQLTMAYPDGYDYAFMVERLDGTDVDDNEIWTPIHTGTNKFVQGTQDYELPTDDSPLSSPRTYRALVYCNAEPDSNVLILHTQGTYTDSVSI